MSHRSEGWLMKNEETLKDRKASPTVTARFHLLVTPSLIALQISQIIRELNKIHTGINK